MYVTTVEEDNGHTHNKHLLYLTYILVTRLNNAVSEPDTYIAVVCVSERETIFVIKLIYLGSFKDNISRSIYTQSIGYNDQ
jgi:hypothetical protein